MVRFPGRIAAGSESNEIVSHQDWFPTILAVAGEPDIAATLKAGHTIGDKTCKVHLWMFRHIYLLVPAQAYVAEFLATFREFPPRQKTASFRRHEVRRLT